MTYERDPPLKQGSFYWVQPVHDVDFVPPGFEGQHYSAAMGNAMSAHWSSNKQPALFDGLNDSGDEVWIYLGIEEDRNDPWPVCWVGDEITKRES